MADPCYMLQTLRDVPFGYAFVYATLAQICRSTTFLFTPKWLSLLFAKAMTDMTDLPGLRRIPLDPVPFAQSAGSNLPSLDLDESQHSTVVQLLRRAVSKVLTPHMDIEIVGALPRGTSIPDSDVELHVRTYKDATKTGPVPLHRNERDEIMEEFDSLCRSHPLMGDTNTLITNQGFSIANQGFSISRFFADLLSRMSGGPSRPSYNIVFVYGEYAEHMPGTWGNNSQVMSEKAKSHGFSEVTVALPQPKVSAPSAQVVLAAGAQPSS